MTTPNIDFTFDTFMPMQWVMRIPSVAETGSQTAVIQHGKRPVDGVSTIRLEAGTYLIQVDKDRLGDSIWTSFYFREHGAGGTFNFGSRDMSFTQRVTIPWTCNLTTYVTLDNSQPSIPFYTITAIRLAPLASDVDKMNT